MDHAMHSNGKTEIGLTFDEVVHARRSVRAFLPQPVAPEIIHRVLEQAQRSPSNCNTQPWNVHVVSGAKRNALSLALHEANNAGRYSLDFSFSDKAFTGRYDERRREQGQIYYESLGVKRDDQEARAKAASVNFSFFNAPHAAFLFMPVVGDNVRVAGDLGMYGQTFLLALAAQGLGGVPQTVLGMFADTVRDVLGVSSDQKLLYGISFGYADEGAHANQTRMGRDPISANVTFHD